jgi:hypothetical protein
MTVTRPTDAGVAFDVASMRGSWLTESICAGRITDRAIVITVIAMPAIPSVTRGIDGSYVLEPTGDAPGTPNNGVLFSLFKSLLIRISLDCSCTVIV